MARDRAQRQDAKALRLFVAVEVPQDLRTGLEEAVERWRAAVPEARWTAREGWHVTMKFLGSTRPRLLDEVTGAIDAAAAGSEPLTTALTVLGVFPSPRRARVVWAGLDDEDLRFPALATRLDESLAERFGVERRPFAPHLTLARLRRPADVSDVGLVGTSIASPRFAVDRLVLYRSHLSPRGATYEPMHVAVLGAATG